MTKKVHDDVIEALTQALEYFEDHEDVVDGSYGEPSPNREMSLAQLCRDALDHLAQDCAMPPLPQQYDPANLPSVIRTVRWVATWYVAFAPMGKSWSYPYVWTVDVLSFNPHRPILHFWLRDY